VFDLTGSIGDEDLLTEQGTKAADASSAAFVFFDVSRQALTNRRGDEIIPSASVRT